jgi:hypothetical protein
MSPATISCDLVVIGTGGASVASMTGQQGETDDRLKLDVWDLVVLGRSAGVEIDSSTLESVAAAWGKPDATLTDFARYGMLKLYFEHARLRQVELDTGFSELVWDENDDDEGRPRTLDFGPGGVLLKGREYASFSRLPRLLEWLPGEGTVSFQYDPQGRRVWVQFAQDNRWGHIGFAAAACPTRGGLFDIDYHCATIRVGRN